MRLKKREQDLYRVVKEGFVVGHSYGNIHRISLVVVLKGSEEFNMTVTSY
jgi:hypothetical protein